MADKQISGWCWQCDEQRLGHHQGVNHILHLLLTLITFGLWLPVWIIISISNGGKPYLCPVCGNGVWRAPNACWAIDPTRPGYARWWDGRTMTENWEKIPEQAIG